MVFLNIFFKIFPGDVLKSPPEDSIMEPYFKSVLKVSENSEKLTLSQSNWVSNNNNMWAWQNGFGQGKCYKCHILTNHNASDSHFFL